eukprot:GHUV01018841.1.p1 GENE.GHUV01018841.1~~GHUV01018841.1.p1  ORF type:complete len:363 (+),score=137.20 GHUV01018841.1:871-1959(+)
MGLPSSTPWKLVSPLPCRTLPSMAHLSVLLPVTLCPYQAWQHQQLRGYAAKGKGRAAAAPAAPPPKPPTAVDPYAPPEFRLKRVPNAVKGNVLNKLTADQKALLQQLNPSSSQVRSLRQLGWPLGSKQLWGLLHDQLGDAAGTNVQVVPFVLDGYFQSAITLATAVKELMEDGQGMPSIEQHLLTTIANLPPSEVTFDGIKVQVKGRMSGKGGMTTKRVWQWGRTSTANLSDPVDYAHEAVITRAGHVGIKVWIRYMRSVMQPQAQHSTRSDVTVPELLAQAGPVALRSRSSSAWWNTPGPLQPRQHKTWECFSRSYDPLTSNLSSLQQRRQEQQQLQAAASAGAAQLAAAKGGDIGTGSAA